MDIKHRLLKLLDKRKVLAVLRILIITAGLLYILFFISNNFILDTQINVYFSNENAMYLKAEQREINEDEELYYQVIDELLAGPESNDLRPTIPEGVKLIDYSIKDENITLNFNYKLRENHWGGSTGEMLTVYSIVNSYTYFSEIESVSFLLEGEKIDSLVGHLDLSRPLMYNQKLVAD